MQSLKSGVVFYKMAVNVRCAECKRILRRICYHNRRKVCQRCFYLLKWEGKKGEQKENEDKTQEIQE